MGGGGGGGRAGMSLGLNFGWVLIPLGVEVREAASGGMVNEGEIGFGEGGELGDGA